MLTRLAVFDTHYLIACKWRDAQNWAICGCVDFSEIAWC